MDNEGRDKCIDSLKGIGILGVIAVHSGMGFQSEPLESIGNFGAYAVQLFFIISTYLAFKTLEKNKITDLIGYRNFLIKKVKRIAPLYYLALVAALIQTGGKGNPYWSGGGISKANILSHVFFLNGLNPYWQNSIMSVEWYIADLMLFYILLPLIYKLCDSLKKTIICLIVSTCLVSIINFLMNSLSIVQNDEIVRNFVNNFSLINQFPVMVFGIILYYLMSYKSSMSNSVGILMLFSGVYLLICLIFNSRLRVVSTYYLTAIGIVMLILGLEIVDFKFACNLIFQKLGRASLGMYLFHYRIISFGFKIGWLVNGCDLLEYIYKYLLIVILSFVITIIVNKILTRIEYIFKFLKYGEVSK